MCIRDRATLDSNTGIEWLDLSETVGMSMDYVVSQTGGGGEFAGWRLPTSDELNVFFDEIIDPAVVTKSGETKSNALIDDIELFYSLQMTVHSVLTGFTIAIMAQ